MYSEDRVETPEYEEKGATYIENDETVSLSPEHREYLMQRHGTLELDPMPSMSPADPYNWPQWKVCCPRCITLPQYRTNLNRKR